MYELVDLGIERVPEFRLTSQGSVELTCTDEEGCPFAQCRHPERERPEYCIAGSATTTAMSASDRATVAATGRTGPATKPR
ncbi:hypothetical protein [Nocardia mangyaensis]|uniref:hypothetical protein n=1 Tax=Nocardia mangyaensis TaxID=2213200 RepID=UPI002676B6D0|nr:hypothetical protein [Nocardia mangyaensis]MDO3648212.1 hypothetical protein [Nocardia mangyaensis]